MVLLVLMEEANFVIWVQNCVMAVPQLLGPSPYLWIYVKAYLVNNKQKSIWGGKFY